MRRQVERFFFISNKGKEILDSTEVMNVPGSTSLNCDTVSGFTTTRSGSDPEFSMTHQGVTEYLLNNSIFVKVRSDIIPIFSSRCNEIGRQSVGGLRLDGLTSSYYFGSTLFVVGRSGCPVRYHFTRSVH